LHSDAKPQQFLRDRIGGRGRDIEWIGRTRHCRSFALNRLTETETRAGLDSDRTGNCAATDSAEAAVLAALLVSVGVHSEGRKRISR
jgi:hypothetical protein